MMRLEWGRVASRGNRLEILSGLKESRLKSRLGTMRYIDKSMANVYRPLVISKLAHPTSSVCAGIVLASSLGRECNATQQNQIKQRKRIYKQFKIKTLNKILNEINLK